MMLQDVTYQRRTASGVVVSGYILALGFWVIDSALDAFLFGVGTFQAQLFSPEPTEIYMRLVVAGLFLAFSLYATAVTRRRKRVAASLRESEACFRDLIEGSCQGILIHRNDQVLFVNQSYADIFGYKTPDDIQRLDSLVTMIAPHERDRLLRYRDKRLAGETVPLHYEYQGMRRDGSLVWLDMQVRVVSWDGAPAIQSTVFDITDRKQVEKEVSVRVQQQAIVAEMGQRALEGHNLSVLMDDIALFLSQALDVEYTTIFEFLPDDDTFLLQAGVGWHDGLVGTTTLRADTQSQVDYVLLSNEPVIVEDLRTETRFNGPQLLHDHNVVSSMNVIIAGTERPYGVLGVHTVKYQQFSQDDIAFVQAMANVLAEAVVRKQAEDALRESEARFRQMAETIQDVFWMSDATTHHVLYVSPAYEVIWGHPCQELYAAPNSWSDAIHPEDRARVMTAFERRRHGERTEVEYRITQPNGAIRWIRDRGFPIRDLAGRVYRLTGIAADITERKQGEEDRQRLEFQLHQAQKMEAIGTLAGGIAHEFNNVLSAILGYTDLTQYEVAQGSVAWSNLQEVLKASRRAKDLVQQILAFSHQRDQVRESLRVALVVREALLLLRASLPATIEIHQELNEAGGTVLANRTQLHQVVMNLCVNAEQAMRETGGTLDISVISVQVDAAFAAHHPSLQTGPYVCLRIRDTGPGMPPEVVEHIFEPFFTTKNIGEGTGMGLAIVHGIVTSHGGAITVDSTPGVGTTFAVYLPQIASGLETDEQVPAADRLARGQGRLLFVDDEAMLVRMGYAMLTRLGYEVVACTSGVEALNVFRAEPARFDLVITNQTMPQMTGEELARELRRLRPDIPIILCTGFSHVMNAEKARALGINAFYMKPLVAHDVAVMIDEVLQKQITLDTSTGESLLLIDDDEQLRYMFRRILEGAGYDVVEARDGREGLQQYKATPTDVIITDLLMPGQEGLETIEALRQHNPAARIIAISGGGHSGALDYLHVAKQLGAQVVLRKPFGRDELLKAVREVLQG